MFAWIVLPPLTCAQDESSIPWNPTHDASEGAWGRILPGLIAAVAGYIVWQLFVRLLISQKERVPWERLRYRLPTAMASLFCVSVWILS